MEPTVHDELLKVSIQTHEKEHPTCEDKVSKGRGEEGYINPKDGQWFGAIVVVVVAIVVVRRFVSRQQQYTLLFLPFQDIWTMQLLLHDGLEIVLLVLIVVGVFRNIVAEAAVVATSHVGHV